MIVALAGGVGGAKLVYGLQQVVPAEELTVVVNTADDLVIHSLHVSPDLDTIMYTLAGLANPASGWGIRDDTFGALGMLARYGKDTWFKLGDRDIATHLVRKELLESGKSLTEVTECLCRALGVEVAVLPMTDDRVSTAVLTDEGELEFQDYFVRRRGQDAVSGVRFRGVDTARITAPVARALETADAVILCPSNPIVSIGPILAVGGVRQRLQTCRAAVVAVSPIVSGDAVSGPAGRMLAGLGFEVSNYGVSQCYADFLDGLVIDRADEAEAQRVRDNGMAVLVANTIMKGPEDKVALAQQVLEFAASITRTKSTGRRPAR